MSENSNVYERAKVIPGHSLTRSKAPGKLFPVDAGPMYASHGYAAVIVDVDGREYIDMLCALGAVSLGYGLATTAARTHLASGWTLSLPSHLEAAAGEKVISSIAPWATGCRFVKTGSEAVHAAVMTARAATGRSVVLVADNSYHGWHSWVTARLRAKGIPSVYGSAIGTYRYGDIASLTSAAEMAGTISSAGITAAAVAAVVIEPARWESTPDGFVEAVRKWCDTHGAVLIYDDMVWGLRAAMGGSAEWFGVKPDMACFGKALGNGAPIACVVGDIKLLEEGELVSGTYSGDMIALGTVIEVLQTYETEPVLHTMFMRGEQLCNGLGAAIQDTGWTGGAVMEGVSVTHQRLRFVDPSVGPKFAAEMAARGVLWHPEVTNFMYTHTASQIDRVVEAGRESLIAVGGALAATLSGA